MFKTILLIFAVYFSSPIELNEIMHDFHLSNTQLKYKSDDNILQLSVKIFIDDLESALKAKAVTDLYIGTEKESESSDIHIEEYLKEVFRITSGDQNLSSEFLGKEISDDLASLWCYIQFEDVSDCTNLEVTNTILTEMFDDQKNIFTFSTEAGRKAYFTFDSNDKVKTFSCE